MMMKWGLLHSAFIVKISTIWRSYYTILVFGLKGVFVFTKIVFIKGRF